MKKGFKKILILIFITNFICTIFQCKLFTYDVEAASTNNVAPKDRLEAIKEKGTITIAAPSNDITYFYKDNKSNKYNGIDADIINEISRRLGINNVEVKQMPFFDLLSELINDNNIDIGAGGIYITPEREKLVSFTQPLYLGSEAIIVPTFSKINFISDLKNAVVGVERGTVFEGLAQKWKQNNLIKDIVFYQNPPELFNAVNGNKVDAGISDSVIVKHYLSENKNLFLRLLKGYTPEITGNVGIAVRKNDNALLSALNDKISEIKADGTLYAILVENGLDKSNMISQ